MNPNYPAAFPNLTAKANDQLRLLWIGCGWEDRRIEATGNGATGSRRKMFAMSGWYCRAFTASGAGDVIWLYLCLSFFKTTMKRMAVK